MVAWGYHVHLFQACGACGSAMGAVLLLGVLRSTFGKRYQGVNQGVNQGEKARQVISFDNQRYLGQTDLGVRKS